MDPVAAYRNQPHLLLIGTAGALVAGVTLLAIAGVVPLPDVDGALEDASRTLGGWAYPAVAGFAFLETGAFVGLLVPGETAVVVGGVVAARGEVELVPLIGLVWLAAGAGDLISFLLGRRLGRPFIERHGPRMHLGPERLAYVERFYARHGGKAVLLGRFTGLVRAVSPFVAGASGFGLRRFLPWSLAGALLWATTFTVVGYGFSESFAESGQTAARIALAAALAAAIGFAAAALIRWSSGRLGRRPDLGDAQRDDRAEGAERGPDERSRHHIEGEVHAQVDARERHRGGDRERPGPKPWAQDRDGGRGGEGRGAVTGGKRGIVGERGKRAESRIRHGRPGAVEELFQAVGGERGDAGGDRRSGEGERQSPAAQVGAEPEPDEQRALDPPRREQHEDSREQRVLEGLRAFDERAIEVEQRSHRPDRPETSRAHRLLIAVNGRASGIADPEGTGRELVAVLEELGDAADALVTSSEGELWDVLRSAAAAGRRVVLVGGDGTMHAAANAPLKRLPELALVPAGRANNVARAMGIPTTRVDALRVAAGMPARPLDALRVVTPDRSLYAVEAVSGGFQAEARAAYDADNSADLRQGLRALLSALRRFRPYSAALRVDDSVLRSESAAQVFLSNLPYFGFGFQVDPGADPSDGRLEAILFEARGTRRLLRLLAATRRGRHLGKRGVLRVPATRAELNEPLPLVADAVPLGTTTATVSVEPARLRVASPREPV
jgi:membrane-associated protein